MENKQLIAARAFLYKDSGETLVAGLIREFQEEFHIDIIVEAPFYAFTYVFDNNTTHTVEVDYFARMTDPTQEIKLNQEDHSEYKWITQEEVDTYFKEDDTVRMVVHKGFQLLGL